MRGTRADANRRDQMPSTGWIWLPAAVSIAALVYLTVNDRADELEAPRAASLESIAVDDGGSAAFLYREPSGWFRLVLRDASGDEMWRRQISPTPSLESVTIAIDTRGVAVALDPTPASDADAGPQLHMFSRSGERLWMAAVPNRSYRTNIALGSQRVYLQSDQQLTFSRDDGRMVPLSGSPISGRLALLVRRLGRFDLVRTGYLQWRVGQASAAKLSNLSVGCLGEDHYVSIASRDKLVLTKYDLDGLAVISRHEIAERLDGGLLDGCFVRGEETIIIGTVLADPDSVFAARISADGKVRWSTRTAGLLNLLRGEQRRGVPSRDRGRGRFAALAISENSVSRLALLDTETGQWSRLPVRAGPRAEIISLADCWLFIDYNKMTAIDVDTGKLLSRETAPFRVWAANGDRLWLGELSSESSEPRWAVLNACTLTPLE